MKRSKPTFIKRRNTSSSKDTERNIPISQSLPVNYCSSLFPRAPRQKPIAAPKMPPKMTLSGVPEDFQCEYAGSTKVGNMSFSLRTFTGPAISASLPTWGKNPFLTGNGLRRRGVSSNKRIAGSPLNSFDLEPRSLRTLSMMNFESKGRTSSQNVVSEGKTPLVKALEKLQINEVFGSDEDEDEDDGLFEMEL